MKITLPILAAMLCLSLTACTSSPSESQSDSSFQSSVQSTDSKSETTSSSSSSSSSTIVFPKLEKFKQTGKITETVLYDQNNVKITATGLTYNNYEAQLELNIENNTAKDLDFRSGTLAYCCNSVNNYMVDMGYLNCEVAAGKKANVSVKLSYSSLQMYGINEIAEIEIGFDIDAADIFNDEFEKIYTGPCAVKTSISGSHDYSGSTFREAMSDLAVQGEFGFTLNYTADDKLYDSNGISVISEVIATNKDGDKMLFLEMENDTSEAVNIQTSDITLNGLKLYGSNYSYDTINPGKRCVVDLSFDNMLDMKYWDAFGLSEVNSADLTMKFIKDDLTEIGSADLTVTANTSGKMFSADGAEIYNKNGIRIISKGLFGGEYNYDDDCYLLLLVENSSAATLTVDDKYDSLSVNGYMTDYYCGSVTLKAGEAQALKIRLNSDSLVKNKAEDISSIVDIEFTVRIRDEKYKDIDNAVVNITF